MVTEEGKGGYIFTQRDKRKKGGNYFTQNNSKFLLNIFREKKTLQKSFLF